MMEPQVGYRLSALKVEAEATLGEPAFAKADVPHLS
jgi:hypothetical protein